MNTNPSLCVLLTLARALIFILLHTSDYSVYLHTQKVSHKLPGPVHMTSQKIKAATEKSNE